MKNRNKLLIITSIIFAVFAIVFLVVGFALSGVDILAWFKSKWAMLFYMVFGVYAIFLGYIFIGDWIRRL